MNKQVSELHGDIEKLPVICPENVFWFLLNSVCDVIPDERYRPDVAETLVRPVQRLSGFDFKIERN